jgi:hypothetical protein
MNAWRSVPSGVPYPPTPAGSRISAVPGEWRDGLLTALGDQ